MDDVGKILGRTTRLGNGYTVLGTVTGLCTGCLASGLIYDADTV
jgi:hypothetical protein